METVSATGPALVTNSQPALPPSLLASLPPSLPPSLLASLPPYWLPSLPPSPPPYWPPSLPTGFPPSLPPYWPQYTHSHGMPDVGEDVLQGCNDTSPGLDAKQVLHMLKNINHISKYTSIHNVHVHTCAYNSCTSHVHHI